MTFRVKSKIKGQTYLYEVESYWDKEKKVSRQRRKLIGKLEPQSQEVIPTRSAKSSKIHSSFDYGVMYFLSAIIEQVGIMQSLRESFPDLYDQILHLCCYRIASDDALYLYEDWAQENYLKQECVLSSQRISELFLQLSENEKGINEFFKRWVCAKSSASGVMFDITSFSSYSQDVDIFEYGYNRDGDNLAQTNLGVVQDAQNAVPLFYKIYPGSISDVSTLKNIASYASEYGLNKILFVLDRGFYSWSNLCELISKEHEFLISMPINNNIARKLIKEAGDIESGTDCFTVSDQAYFYSITSLSVEDSKVATVIYFNQEIKAAEIKRFITELEDCETVFSKKNFKTQQEAQSYVKENFKSKHQYYTVEEMKLKRLKDKIEEQFTNFGKFILLSSVLEIQPQGLLEQYRSKDRIEKTFYSIKNEFASKKLRVKTEQTLKGKIFFLFITSIIKSHIDLVMKEKKLYQKFTLRKLVACLRKLKLYKLESGSQLLSEVSKKQKDVYTAFNIELPTVPSVNFLGF